MYSYLRKTRQIFFVLLLLLSFFRSPVPEAKAAEQSKAALSVEDKTLYTGNRFTLKLKNADAGDIRWKSSNKAVAEIKKQNGRKAVIAAKKKGTATIRAKYEGKVYKCHVTVKKQSVSAVSLIMDKGEIETVAFRGKKSKTRSKVVKWSKMKSKAATDDNIYWAVKNPSVISVSKKNNSSVKIKVKKEGNTVISAKYRGKAYQCKVTTKDPKLDYSTAALGVKNKKTITFKGKRKSATSQIVDWNTIFSKPDTQNVLYWAVKDSDIATISKKNSTTITVKGEKVGTTYVRLKYRGKLYQCQVKVVIPSYWNAEMNVSVDTVLAREENNPSMAKFIYMTDSHWKSNAQRSPALIHSLSQKLDIPFTVFGGDAITSHHDSQESAIAELKDFYAQFDGNVLSTTGNHDWNTESNDNVISYLTEDQLFKLMYDKQTTFAVTENNGKCAYLDDFQHKVRYISFYFDTRTNIEPYVSWWVDNHIKELPEGWTVMLFSHAYYCASKLGAVEKTIPGAKEYAEHLLELQNLAQADVAVWMVGHCHRNLSSMLTYQEKAGSDDAEVTEDAAVTVTQGALQPEQDSGQTSKEAPTLLVVSTNCDTYKQSTPWGGDSMTLGTDTEQAFEIVQIDTNNRHLYLTRVGAGEDRSFYY